jgi:hypothetical protein
VSLGEINFWIFRLLLLIGPFGRLEDFNCETLESVIVLGLMLSLGVENADLTQETVKLSRHGPIFFVTTRPLYVGHGEVCLPLLVMTLEGGGLI